MVVLIKKLPNFTHKSKKLDQPNSIALQSFQTNISESLNKLFSGQKLGSVTLYWFIPCFKFIQGMNRAFAKLVKDLDYPLNKWDQNLTDDYFSYTLSLLDALNSISSSISHMGISKLKLSHAVNLINDDHDHPCSAIQQHLKPIIPRKIQPLNSKEIKVLSFNCDKERVIYEAMIKLRSVYMLISLNFLKLGESGDDLVKIKEIEEVNEAVKKVEECLGGGNKKTSNDAAIELKRKLIELEKLVEIVGKEANSLFSDVLAWRNELLDGLRLPKCT